MNTQLSFGWAEQGKCMECGIPFIHTYPAFIAEWHWSPSMFYSIKFCSQECANVNIKKLDEAIELFKSERRKWG